MDDTTDKAILIDIINSRHYVVTDPDITAYNLLNHLKISEFGLTLSDRYLVKQMGSRNAGEFLRTREEFYEKWHF